MENVEVQEVMVEHGEMTMKEVLDRLFLLEEVPQKEVEDLIDAFETAFTTEDPDLVEEFYLQLSNYGNLLGVDGKVLMATAASDEENEVVSETRIFVSDIEAATESLHRELPSEVEKDYVFIAGLLPEEQVSYPVVNLAKFATFLLKVTPNYKEEFLRAVVDLDAAIYHIHDTFTATC